jgi:hypothetical protein
MRFNILPCSLASQGSAALASSELEAPNAASGTKNLHSQT